MALLALLAIAGCGGNGQGNDQEVRNVVDHFTVGIGRGDLKSACGLTTGSLRATCSATPTANPTLASFTSLTISKVVISGNQATVAFNGSSEVMTLAKRDGTWLISSA